MTECYAVFKRRLCLGLRLSATEEAVAPAVGVDAWHLVSAPLTGVHAAADARVGRVIRWLKARVQQGRSAGPSAAAGSGCASADGLV